MNTPSIVFYEHNLDDSQLQSLSKSVLNLGNECRALAEENASLKALTERMNDTINLSQAECRRLKAEVERLNDLIISGGAVNPDASVYIE